MIVSTRHLLAAAAISGMILFVAFQLNAGIGLAAGLILGLGFVAFALLGEEV